MGELIYYNSVLRAMSQVRAVSSYGRRARADPAPCASCVYT